MKTDIHKISISVKGVCLFLTASFFVASLAAAWYIDVWDQILPGWFTILTSPCPLVTDYFALGNLASAFFNAGICGLACCGLIIGYKSECHANTLACFILVVAHCFYGLNFLNMWPPMLGIYLFCRFMKIEWRSNINMAMLATAFGPFVSELLFRYPFGEVLEVGGIQVTEAGLVMVVVFSIFVGFAIPAMLPGAMQMHKGYDLYNGGLAFGLVGLFIYAFMYKTLGIDPPQSQAVVNEAYAAHGNSYLSFAVIYFVIIFGCFLAAGWYSNGKSFRGYRALMEETGHHTDFMEEHGAPLVLINLGCYGLMMLLYFVLVIYFTEGAGATGATVGVILAATTFVGVGQHPKNVWPILLGYAVLSVLVHGLCGLAGLAIPWTLSTQAYLNGAAFATGLSPLAGRYGWKVGTLAGFMCAVLCSSTSAIHGGFVLYNGGLTAGITALILVPCLEYYYHGKVKPDVIPEE